MRHLPAEQRPPFTSALAGFYKLAGADFIREQLASVLPPSIAGYQLSEHDLVVWTERGAGHAVAYDLRQRGDTLTPRFMDHAGTPPLPPLDARRLFYARTPITWQQWSDCWERDQKGEGHPPLFREEIRLWPVEKAASTA
jgi:hypothetical protein